MKFVFMFFMSLVVLIITRIVLVLVWELHNKERKVKKKREVSKGSKLNKKLVDIYKFFMPVVFSLLALLLFLAFWGIVMLIYLEKKQVYDELFLYVIFTFYGVAAIIWCYFRWDLKWGTRPKFEIDKNLVSLKKVIVFSVIMVFAFYYGYNQLKGLLEEEKKIDNGLAIYNATMISGMIALDRVLNQVSSVYSAWKAEQKKNSKQI